MGADVVDDRGDLFVGQQFAEGRHALASMEETLEPILWHVYGTKNVQHDVQHIVQQACSGRLQVI
jgi:hypothetical protein